MDDSIKDLLEVGLTEYEAKVYTAMLKHDLLTALDLTKLSGVPRGRIYDIINQLIEKGFCITVPGTVKKFKADNPESAIKHLIEEQKSKENIMLETARRLQERFNSRKITPKSLDYINILTSKQSQIKKFQELEETSKDFILTFSKRPYATSLASMDDIIRFSEPQKAIIQKGIKSKGIYEADEAHFKNFEKWIRYFSEIGEEVRICEELPLKMLISDNSTVMLSLRNEGADKFNLLSMVVEHSDLTNALIKLFYFYWNKSMTIDQYIKFKNK
ncbi:MAG: helix-turn-helix domain-containing protein [Ignavibacteria bacterium]|nr:helix-turn-helix domain-containing protein [Ignavibacteria bacterium]